MTDWLVGTLLATSGLIVLVLLLREPVRRHFGSRVAYGLWLLPAARLLLPTFTHTVERPMSLPVPPRLIVSQVSVEPLLLASVSRPETSVIDSLGGWPAILITVWLSVALGLFIGRMAAFRRERSAILASAVRLGAIGTITLLRSPAVRGPLAFGIFRKVIAVPADFDLLYAPHERRLALEHELSHHRSGDLVVNFIAFVLLCLQWFNPLAWMAHAAFRFDQEAACDARVLDRVNAQDRADYGRAIAKAASGQALLFASALDRRNTLHKRLLSMLSNPSSGRRLAGRLIILASAVAILPLTATRAVNYVDPPSEMAAPVAPAAPAAPLATAAPVAPLAPKAVAALQAKEGLGADSFDPDGTIFIDGQQKRWRDISAEEKARIRQSIAKAKEELSRSHIDRAEIAREIAEAMAEAKVDREEMARELAEARAEIDRAMREIDAEAGVLRRSGHDPERIKASIRQSLQLVEAINVDEIIRSAMSSVDRTVMDASLSAAEDSIARAREEMERLEEKLPRDH